MGIELKILNKEFYTHRHIYNNPDCPWSTEYKDLPNYATKGSAGLDLVCTEDIIVYPGETKTIHTGLAIWIGSGGYPNLYMGMIVPRSGLGTKGLILANTIGIIDSDYQGELIVQAWNRNNEYKTIDRYSHEGDWQEIEWNTEDKIELKQGDKFAQLVIVPIVQAKFDIVNEFSAETQRGSNGFGSTD